MAHQWWFRVASWWKFYRKAVNKYKVHSPFVFDWITDVLEDRRDYYAFDAIAALRRKMRTSNARLMVTDFGAGPNNTFTDEQRPATRETTLRDIVRRSGSSPQQGERLFRMVNWWKPENILELGTSVGISTLYMAKAAGSHARFTTLEGCPQCAEVARLNLQSLGAGHVEVITGPFSDTLEKTVNTFPKLDFVFFDGNHREAPTLRYFEVCVTKAHDDTVFVLDDVHWSPGMEAAWEKIKLDPRVTLTIDCGDFACAFFRKTFTNKQHFRIVPSSLKPWMVY